eukprot:gene30126-35106_t
MGSLPDFSETVEIDFHSTSYLLTVSAINGDTLSIEAEQKDDASRWRGDFTARYIEDISTKTGNFKKFTVFVKMLLSALKQASDSVFVDLLTYQDLEVLKNRKNGGSGAQPSARSTNKRYLILTYAAEFDRVHYPLPLQYEEAPDLAHLKAAIARLRSELEVARMESANASGGRRGVMEGSAGGASGSSAELRRLREENSALRQQLKQLERSTRVNDSLGASAPEEMKEMAKALKLVRKERDLLQTRTEHAEVELDKERGLQRRELRRKAKEMQEMGDELECAKETIRDLKAQIRQLMDEAEGGSRQRFSASERTRSAYGQPRAASRPTSRPSSGRGTSPSYAQGTGASSRRDRLYDTSRAVGREYSAPSSRDRSRPGSRPTSAPSAPSPRFDPTAYVQAKRDRLAASSRDRSRGPSHAGSYASSGHSTPYSHSRPASAERSRVREREQAPLRSRGHSPSSHSRPWAANSTGNDRSRPSSSERTRPSAYDRSRPSSSERLRPGWGASGSQPNPNSRPTSGNRQRPAWGGDSPSNSRPSSSDRNQSGSNGRAPPRLPDITSRSRGSSPTLQRRQVSEAWGDGEGWSKYPLAAAGNRQSQNVGQTVGASTERAQSPGRALQEVKRKLSEYVHNKTSDSSVALAVTAAAAEASASGQGGGGQATVGPSDSMTSEATKANGFDDASSDIADIDSRLHALQNFLKMAKSSQGSVPA